MSNHRYIFGPVPSRRLGRSLGVDLTPMKTCTENCIFCQLGPTPCCTLERKEWVPFAAVLAELETWLANGGAADFITLSGSGEPTLHTRFGDLLTYVKTRTPFSTALLSNGTLLYLSEVRTAAAQANIVKATLSAWDEPSFQRMHRPVSGMTFAQVLGGMTAFRNEFKGIYWLEIMVLAGINDDDTSMQRIAALAKQINPDCIHLNTTVRPAAEAEAKQVSRERLEQLAALFGSRAEIIADFRSTAQTAQKTTADDVFALMVRHPLTCADVSRAFGLTPEESEKHLAELLRTDRIKTEHRDGHLYHLIK